MTTYNAENERAKRRYFTFQREAKQRSDASIDAIAKALNRFEVYTRFKSFRAFRIEQAVAQIALELFRRRLFQPVLEGYGDCKDAERERVPTLEQIRYVLEHLPFGTDIEKRNRALIAFTLLTGARDNAIASMRLKHVDLVEGKIMQDARQVRTKFSKTFPTYFFPVYAPVQAIVAEWVTFLQQERLWGSDDPLFPATRVLIGPQHHFEAAGLERKCWANATSIRAIFRVAFTAAALPYFNPHSFRKTLARLGQQTCRTPEEFKAWSQNLGHESPMTTFANYGQVATPYK